LVHDVTVDPDVVILNVEIGLFPVLMNEKVSVFPERPIDTDILHTGAAVPVVDVTEDPVTELLEVGFAVVEVTATEVLTVGFAVVEVAATAEAEVDVVTGTGQVGPQEITLQPLFMFPHVVPDNAQVVVGLHGAIELHPVAGKARCEPTFPAGEYSQA